MNFIVQDRDRDETEMLTIGRSQGQMLKLQYVDYKHTDYKDGNRC